MHRSNETFGLCIGLHLHQAATEATGVHPQGPLKVKDLAAPAVKALQGAGASRAATLEAHARCLWAGKEEEEEEVEDEENSGTERVYCSAQVKEKINTFHCDNQLWAAASCGDAVDPPGDTLWAYIDNSPPSHTIFLPQKRRQLLLLTLQPWSGRDANLIHCLQHRDEARCSCSSALLFLQLPPAHCWLRVLGPPHRGQALEIFCSPVECVAEFGWGAAALTGRTTAVLERTEDHLNVLLALHSIQRERLTGHHRHGSSVFRHCQAQIQSWSVQIWWRHKKRKITADHLNYSNLEIWIFFSY